MTTVGMPVLVRRVGRPQPPAAAVQLCAYRVVQEALTNVLRHAGAAPTAVVLTYGADALRVEVVNERGTAPTTAGAGSGRGLLGMRERVRIAGADFEHGPTTSGGCRVSAVLPLTPDKVSAEQGLAGDRCRAV